MKISICIPQYNRIAFLLKNLRILEGQTYENLEVVVSDDCSTDDTARQIKLLKKNYRYPLIYFRQKTNQGYDANLRKSLELASGDYCFILGNDDTLKQKNDMARLAAFLKKHDLPEVGFCNFIKDGSLSVNKRAMESKIMGSGPDVALRYHKSFSFVAGIIFKKTAFEAVNTDKVDKSIYVQIYLATLIIAKGGRLFTIKDPMVVQDIQIDGKMANSYRDKLARKWQDFKPIDSGLPQVAKVVVTAFDDAQVLTEKVRMDVLRRIYQHTYPFWLLNFRKNNAFVSSVALMVGLRPKAFSFVRLNFFNRTKIFLYYILSSLIGLLTPVFLFEKFKLAIYRRLKK